MESECNFEKIVSDNQKWLLNYVMKIVGNRHTAEDIVQEVFLRAYKSLSSYEDIGKEKQWLLTIARNTSLRYLRSLPTSTMTLDGNTASITEDIYLLDAVSLLEPSVEDEAVTNELRVKVMTAIAQLPVAQRTVVYLRYIEDYSVNYVAELTRLSPGSVKSKSHYGLQKLRNALVPYQPKEVSLMSCKEIYALLFQYAKGQIQFTDKQVVDAHIAKCESCRVIAESLQILAGHMTPALDGEMYHYMVALPLADGNTLHYFGLTFPVNDFERMNAVLRMSNGSVPANENWFSTGHDSDFQHIAEFDNEGHHVEFELVPNPHYSGNVRVKYKKMVEVYPQHSMHSVGLRQDKFITPQVEAPGLFIGKLQNQLGNNAKSCLYLAIPGSSANVRIRKGNGVIDAGAYKFPYSERYVTDEETNKLEFTFINQ